MVLLTFSVPNAAEFLSANQVLDQRERAQARDHGLLGNVLAHMFNFGVTEKAVPNQQVKGRDYGPLGNLLVKLAKFGRPTGAPSTDTAKGTITSTDSAELVTSKTKGMPSGPDRSCATLPKSSSMSAQALKGIRELLKMLWSNFLPDPTFDRAIAALIHRDQHLGMDAEEGEGGFITAAEKSLILSRTITEVEGKYKS